MKILGNMTNMQYHRRITPCYIYLAILVNENEIPMELLCQLAHLSLIKSLISIKILKNKVHMQYHPRKCYIISYWKFVKWNHYWVIVLTNSSGPSHVLNMLNEHENFDQYGPCATESEKRLCAHSTAFVGIKKVSTLESIFPSLTDIYISLKDLVHE